MSQQEFQSQEDSKQSTSAEEGYRRARFQKRKAEPKYEHPSTYDESIPPYHYQAQDAARAQQKQEQQTKQARQESGEARTRRQNFSPDGDKFETGYRPYQDMWQRQAPSWARSQIRARGLGRSILLTVLAVFAIIVTFKVLLLLLGILAIFAVGFLFFALIVIAIGGIAFWIVRRSIRRSLRRTSWHW